MGQNEFLMRLKTLSSSGKPFITNKLELENTLEGARCGCEKVCNNIHANKISIQRTVEVINEVFKME
jgi:hypothetical protein